MRPSRRLAPPEAGQENAEVSEAEPHSFDPGGASLTMSIGHYLVLSGLLFAIGTAGVFLRRSLITLLLSVEIMLNAVKLAFVAFGRQLGEVDGQIITFFVMTVAAAEAAVGLALV